MEDDTKARWRAWVRDGGGKLRAVSNQGKRQENRGAKKAAFSSALSPTCVLPTIKEYWGTKMGFTSKQTSALRPAPPPVPHY